MVLAIILTIGLTQIFSSSACLLTLRNVIILHLTCKDYNRQYMMTF